MSQRDPDMLPNWDEFDANEELDYNEDPQGQEDVSEDPVPGPSSSPFSVEEPCSSNARGSGNQDSNDRLPGLNDPSFNNVVPPVPSSGFWVPDDAAPDDPSCDPEDPDMSSSQIGPVLPTFSTRSSNRHPSFNPQVPDLNASGPSRLNHLNSVQAPSLPDDELRGRSNSTNSFSLPPPEPTSSRNNSSISSRDNCPVIARVVDPGVPSVSGTSSQGNVSPADLDVVLPREVGPRMPSASIGPSLPTQGIGPSLPISHIGPTLPSGLGPTLPANIGPSLPSSIGPIGPSSQSSSGTIGPSLPSNMRAMESSHPAEMASSSSNGGGSSSSRDVPSSPVSENDLFVIGPSIPRQIGPAMPPAQGEPVIGPALPPDVLPMEGPIVNQEIDQDIYGPAPPPPENSREESIPPEIPCEEEEEEDDEEIIGPTLPTSQDEEKAAEEYAVRRLLLEKQKEQNTNKREEWMTQLPKKLTNYGLGARTFSKSSVNAEKDSSWTETPEQKRRRLERGESSSQSNSQNLESSAQHARDYEQERIAQQYSSNRSEALLDSHQRKKKSESGQSSSTGERKAFDREKDMEVRGFKSSSAAELKERCGQLSSRFGNSFNQKFL